MINNINADFIIQTIKDSDFSQTEIYRILGHNDNYSSNMKRNGIGEKELRKFCAIFEISESDPRLYLDETEHRTREWTELRKVRSQIAITNARLKRILDVLDIEDVEEATE